MFSPFTLNGELLLVSLWEFLVINSLHYLGAKKFVSLWTIFHYLSICQWGKYPYYLL